MTQGKTKTVGEFGQRALELDAAFCHFEQIAQELERLAIHSDKGMERAIALLQEVDGCRVRMEAGMQAMARALEDARDRSEKAGQSMVERAMAIQERRRETDVLQERFSTLSNMVKQINGAVVQLKQPSAKPSAEERALMLSHLPELNKQMGVLVDEARSLMDEAQTHNMKELVRNADSMRQSLQAARNKLNLVVEHLGAQ